MDEGVFLVCYDISDQKRLREVHKIVSNFGQSLQYSVFLCSLTAIDYVMLSESLRDTIHHKQDQVLFVKLSTSVDTAKRRIQSIGRPLDPHDKRTMYY